MDFFRLVWHPYSRKVSSAMWVGRRSTERERERERERREVGRKGRRREGGGREVGRKKNSNWRTINQSLILTLNGFLHTAKS